MCGCGHVLCTPILSPRPEDPSYPQHLLHLSAAPVPPLPSICSTSPQHLFHLSPAPALPLPSTCSTYPQHLFHLSGYPPAILRLSPGYPPAIPRSRCKALSAPGCLSGWVLAEDPPGGTCVARALLPAIRLWRLGPTSGVLAISRPGADQTIGGPILIGLKVLGQNAYRYCCFPNRL